MLRRDATSQVYPDPTTHDALLITGSGASLSSWLDTSATCYFASRTLPTAMPRPTRLTPTHGVF